VDLALPTRGPAGVPTVSVEPTGSLDLAPGVLRLRVAGGAKRSALSDYRFFSGELSAYHLGRIRSRELPSTLLERELPVLAWVEKNDVLVAPLRSLASGTYSLATPELGLAAEVTVDGALVPILERLWPPPEAASGGGAMVFCGDAASGAEPGQVELEPSGISASVARGLDANGAFSERCVRVEPDLLVEAGVPLLPPALVGSVALEPRLLVVSNDAPELGACTPPEIALGPICGAIDDDRIELRASGAPAFVAFEAPAPLLGAVGPGRSLVLRGFEPSSRARVTGLAFDALGERLAIDVAVEMAPRRPHLVLNEVLANPVGAEAEGEWIEIANDGSHPASLGGFVLDDAIEPVALPAEELEPGRMLLLVSKGYAPDPELDLVPPEGVAVVRVARLGRNGLANAGELLRLRDPDGNVVSRFPARQAPAPGQSVGRKTPDAPDAESASFGNHAPPGASPGEPNSLEEP
jgi:hypothetical protein